MEHFELAEDIATDTFLQASESWTGKGMPENPVAWLYTVAKNKTKDHFRRHRILETKIFPKLRLEENPVAAGYEDQFDIDLSPGNITDSQLSMIFAICNPALPAEAQVALALRVLCGFGIPEIAEAFLTNKETINKRLFRAKEKLRAEQIAISLPPGNEIKPRIDAVLVTIYLLFNAGYYSAASNAVIRKELCIEAMRLNNLLVENEQTNTPAANALLALMCFHASRFEARMKEGDEVVLYADQDESAWDADLIARGNYFLLKSASGNEVTKYHLEASIAYWHCIREDSTTKWESILQIYNRLLQVEYSPIAALNRTYALARVRGHEVAIIEAKKLGLANNHLYNSLLGYLYEHHEDNRQLAGVAISHYELAMSLTKSSADQKMLQKHIEACKSRSI